MATEDISRSATDYKKRYAGVRIQQGRVTLDDDWNENGCLLAEEQRRELVDVVGPAGSADKGFAISSPRTDALGKLTFDIAPGTFYLAGLRLESLGHTYALQPDWVDQPPGSRAKPAAGTRLFAWLEAWQQPVEGTEDDEILEKGLGGPDTATRVRTMWRVHASPTAAADCAAAWADLVDGWAGAAHLGTMVGAERVPNAKVQIGFENFGNKDDLCSPLVVKGYLGAENQTIRLQITTDRKLSWGFDNAAPLYRIEVATDRKTLTFRNLPRDQAHWPIAQQVVEILPWSAVLPNGEKLAELTGHLTTVHTSYDPDRHEIVLEDAIPASFDDWQQREGAKAELGDWTSIDEKQKQRVYYFLRVWDRDDDLSPPAAIGVAEGTVVKLGHTGLNATFHGDQFVPGDHWVIAARPDTPDQILPWEITKAPRAPQGVRRFYAPLGTIDWPAVGNPTAHDCRPHFNPLTRLQSCCTFTVGDNAASFGQFRTIQDAVNALPKEGGKICVLPGRYVESVTLGGKKGVTIEGCGARTRLEPDASNPAITISGSVDIAIQRLAIATDTGVGVSVLDSGTARVTLSELAIDVRDDSAISVRGGQQIRIVRCHVGVKNLAAELGSGNAGRNAAIFVEADDVLIAENEVLVDPVDRFTRMAFGGIQIGGGSEHVEICRNRVVGGHGHAITLGSVIYILESDLGQLEGDWRFRVDRGYYAPAGFGFVIDSQGCIQIVWDPPPPPPHGGGTLIPISAGALYDIRILDNELTDMGHAGISVARFFTDKYLQLIAVERLEIVGNLITRCLSCATSDIPPNVRDVAAFAGIALADASLLVIRENKIEENGVDQNAPICGIFVARAEGMSVENNRIVNNAPQGGDQASPRAGLRGGVVVLRATPPPESLRYAFREVVRQSGSPAARIHDNVIVVPQGRALLLLAAGPLSISRNHLVSRGLGMTAMSFTSMVGKLPILGMPTYGPNYMMSTSGDNLLFDYATGSGPSKLGTQNLFGGGATTSDKLSEALLNALDFIGGVTVTAMELLGSPVLTRDLIAGRGGRTYKLSAEVTLYSSEPATEARPLFGGGILFVDNEVQLDLLAEGTPLVLSSVLLASRGEVSANDNRIQSELLLSNVLVEVLIVGLTSGFVGNSVLERPDRALLSALVIGMASALASSNRTVQCLAVRASDPAMALDQGNVVILAGSNPRGCEYVGRTFALYALWPLLFLKI
jgi:hypothetical protein